MLGEFTVTADHGAHRETVREFCEEEILPRIEEYEERGEFPAELVRRVGEAGLTGVPFSTDVGGGGLDYRSFVVTVEELSRAWKLVAGAVNIACGLVGYPIAEFGTDRHREEWLAPICRGESVPALSMTEPDAGSDAAAMETTARREGDEWVIDGHKVWTTNGEVADFLLVVARTGDESHAGLSLIGIPDPGDRDGVEFVRNIPCMEGDTAIESEIRFDDARVPVENLVGEDGRGFRYVMEGLDIGRIGTAAQGVGLAQGSLDAAKAFADEREQFGQPIREFQGIGFKLADMATRTQAARLLTMYAAGNRDRGERVTQDAAMAKTFATDAAMDIATEAVQVLGSRGYSRDYPVERYMREAKGTQIYDGTNEVNRLVVSKRLYE
ncbi:acyl-CoA dehydrogenase family protein [Haladaptatus salinisoli]|uniref:acyl-CoA dehydrogenase family protein n=1 Tax=Haladaptatus salinisoli TaxID=2884876 RepID=UPI001D0A5441|nr:acyl-CoA dehydrogenase family protein [Haladaptatus salinisoli]